MAELDLLASAAFGMEAIVVRELQDLGYPNAIVEDGRVRFRGDHLAICRTNLWLRCAERVQVVVADFKARDFDQLFDQVKALPWEEWLPVDAKFPVTARCVRSEIRSVPNTQKMVKRAIVERLRKTYSRHWFAESGSEYNVEASILGDRVLITIDTSGDGLHKRGYRNLVGRAPLRETVAAAMVKLSYWNRDRLLVDPFCGSGTIPIEAALIGRNLAPGRNRSFIAETWGQIPQAIWAAARQEIRDLENRQPLNIPIVATDRDRHAIKMSQQHARQAGVETDIHFDVKDFIAFPTNRDAGILICNPPYGERLGDEDEVRRLYADMGELLRPLLDDWSLYILTAAEGFERYFGKTADRRRKLYNARIACTYYQYLGPKPSGIEQFEEEPIASRTKPETDTNLSQTNTFPATPVSKPRESRRPRPAAENPWTKIRTPTRPAGPQQSAPATDHPVSDSTTSPQTIPQSAASPGGTPSPPQPSAKMPDVVKPDAPAEAVPAIAPASSSDAESATTKNVANTAPGTARHPWKKNPWPR